MFEPLLDIKNCACGKNHSLVTREFIVEEHALAKLPALLEKLGVAKSPLAVYDANTFRAAFPKLDSFAPGLDTLVLEGEDIHPDETQIGAISAAAPGHSVLLAVGSGVICDTVSYVGAKLGIPYIAVPTAASVDGFVSNSSAMTLRDAKTTLPTSSPLGVAADLQIVAAAPKYLAAAGVGDMLSKYISIADWHVGHLVTGEYWCPAIAQLELDAVGLVLQNADGIARGEISATGRLMEGLLLSGIAMQLSGITRPASSFEHHFSHYLEVAPIAPNINAAALHGEKVGIASVAAARYYPVFARLLERIFAENLPNRFSMERVEKLYAPCPAGLLEFLERENTPTVTEALDVGLLRENYAEVLRIADSIPTEKTMRSALAAVGGMADYRDIGMTPAQFRDTMEKCCYIRNRFTMLRLVCDYALFDFDAMDG